MHIPGKPPWAQSFSPASFFSRSPQAHPPDDSSLHSHELYAAVASGIGLFIAFIGFRNAGWSSEILRPWSASATCAIPPPRWLCSPHPHGRA